MKKNKNKQGQIGNTLVAVVIALLIVVTVYLILREPQEAVARLDNCENLLGMCKLSCGDGEIEKELGDCGKGLVCCVGEQALV